MTDRQRLTGQQAFFRRVISLSTARWIFLLLKDLWWRERSADGVVTDFPVMQVRGPTVAAKLLNEEQWSLKCGSRWRCWARDLWEGCCRPKCLTPHSRKRTGYFSPNQPTWKKPMSRSTLSWVRTNVRKMWRVRVFRSHTPSVAARLPSAVNDNATANWTLSHELHHFSFHCHHDWKKRTTNAIFGIDRKGIGSGPSSPDSRWRPCIFVTGSLKSVIDLAWIGHAL